MTTDELILVGRVARAHGNRGQVIVNPDTDFPGERFAAGTTLLVGEKAEPKRITSVRFHQGRPVIGLEGVETIDAAETLAGAELKVAAATLAPLPAGTYYRHELVGCEVRDTGGRLIGEVAAVEGPLEMSRLVINAPHGEVLVPLVGDICVEVDPKARRIRVAAPEGLIELNARR
ncbi:MAG TPA: ribosome maturation factor RimM [Vicinamibacterales bacterium]|nr:ribosome maturation factor RimM [Vicinamibacterales bacterium]